MMNSVDTSNHELIGVGFLCIDRLEFLLDLDETVAVVNFSGFPAGNMKMTVKAYIDEVQALPTTIITHVEANIEKFMDHNLIVNFFFESLSGLPENHCTDTYISFKFLNHMPTYTTPQFLGFCTDPGFESTVQVTKPITAALMDYIRTGCMEFKVFAVRSRNARAPMILNSDAKSTDSPISSERVVKQTSSWRSVGSSPGGSVASARASFKGDKASLERKLNQTLAMMEELLKDKQELEQHLTQLEADYDELHHENEVLRNNLASARAEIDNMYNISRGDGATIISNHESTVSPSRNPSFRTPYSTSRRVDSIAENSGSGSRFCSIM
jgi:hypothetical protein